MIFDTFEGFVLLDGAMGTMLQKHGLKAGDRPDIMNITSPRVVEDIHRMYVGAGSDIICTNTFGANAAALKGTGYSPAEIIAAAVSAAKRACGDNTKIALDIGPTGDLTEPFGSLTFDMAYSLFREQAQAGQEAGADLAAIETMSDLTELKAAILAVKENTDLPVLATMTFGKTGRTFTGCLPESFAIMAGRLGASAIGLNCSLAPSEMLSTAERIARMTRLPLIVKPNAGLPDSQTGRYGISPDEFSRQMTDFAKIGARIIGGCCGTSPDYIRELKNTFSKLTPGSIEQEAGEFICCPTRFERAGSAEAVEIRIPDGTSPSDAAHLVVSESEAAEGPLHIISDDAAALEFALRVVGGIPAVSFTRAGSRELVETAAKYGAVII